MLPPKARENQAAKQREGGKEDTPAKTESRTPQEVEGENVQNLKMEKVSETSKGMRRKIPVRRKSGKEGETLR